MDISHLYHDAALSDPTIELDVKEQLQTRIANAREDRHLETLSKSYEKAKFICQKNTAWERRIVGQSLHGICERSPHLDRSLAREKARVEHLQRSILMKNFQIRHHKVKPMSPVKASSPVMRSVSNTTLDPIYSDPNGRKRRRRKEKNLKKETDGLTHPIAERHSQKPGDFVRRTEHVVKSLAKLNQRQQNRRRDHELFKEELKLYSKPVIERARVILKGRSDIDLDNMMNDFESILLPQHAHNNSNLNSMNSFKNSKLSLSSSTSTGTSMLSKANVLQMPDVRRSRCRLPSLSETPISVPADFENTANTNANNYNNNIISPRNSNFENKTPCPNTSERSDNSSTAAAKITNHSEERTGQDSRESKNQNGNEDNEKPPRLNLFPSLSKHDNQSKTSLSQNTPQTSSSPSHQNPNFFYDKSSSNSSTSHSTKAQSSSASHSTQAQSSSASHSTKAQSSPASHSTKAQNNAAENAGQDSRKEEAHHNLDDVISPPATSVSNVIIEEEEEGEGRSRGENKAVDDTDGPHVDGNHDHVETDLESNFSPRSSEPRSTDPRSKDEDGYAMTCTTGLPQLWKSSVSKKKEKAIPEVSAATIARKHRRKRNESERMW